MKVASDLPIIARASQLFAILQYREDACNATTHDSIAPPWCGTWNYWYTSTLCTYWSMYMYYSSGRTYPGYWYLCRSVAVRYPIPVAWYRLPVSWIYGNTNTRVDLLQYNICPYYGHTSIYVFCILIFCISMDLFNTIPRYFDTASQINECAGMPECHNISSIK